MWRDGRAQGQASGDISVLAGHRASMIQDFPVPAKGGRHQRREGGVPVLSRTSLGSPTLLKVVGTPFAPTA